MRLRLVSDSGEDVAPGETGEVLVRADQLMVGYWEDSIATAAAFADEWFRTGDLARMDGNGNLWFMGRKKEVIVCGGEKVFPQEIETVLIEHSDVKEAGVTGISGARAILGDGIVAHVVPRPGTSLSAERLTQFLQSRMAAYEVPDTFVLTDRLPRTPVGKLARKLLRTGG